MFQAALYFGHRPVGAGKSSISQTFAELIRVQLRKMFLLFPRKIGCDQHILTDIAETLKFS